MHTVPYWRSDRDYFKADDPRRPGHLREIEVQERINQRIVASSADGSYAVVVTREDEVGSPRQPVCLATERSPRQCEVL